MLQKGRRLRSPSIILFALILLGLLTTTSFSAGTRRGTSGTVSPLGVQATSLTRPHYNVSRGISQLLQARQSSGTMRPMQGSGPVPDTDLTSNLVLPVPAPIGAVVPRVLDPSTSPIGTQDRLVFVSDGVDVGPDPTNPTPDGRIDPTLPTTDPNFKGNLNLWIMRPDGSEQVQVPTQGIVQTADKREPVFDPGGRLITYASNATGRWEIYQTELSTGVTQVLTAGQPGDKRHPTWSPDSLWIAYSCNASGHYEIYRMRSNGSTAQEQLTFGSDDDTEPSWTPAANALSPSSDAILYTAKTGTVTHINWVDPITKTVTPLTNGGGDPAASDKMAVFSRDANSFAFSSNRKSSGADAAANFNIWTINVVGEVDGGMTPTLLSNLDETATTDSLYPAWLAPLRRQPVRVFFESNRPPAVNPNYHIWSTLISDTTPPVLEDLPWVDNRLPQPGADITIYAPVFDADSGVAHVYARIKNPNQKVWVTSTHLFDTGFTGTRYEEWDYAVVATVELFDDGDLATNGDTTANDGTFSGKWTTGANAQDYVIDIAVQDNAGNSFIYDSIYGFSTKPFSPTSNILFVNDYCEGQKFISNFMASASQRIFNNDFPAAWMTESFYTYNPGGSPPAPSPSPPEPAFSQIDYDSIAGYARSWGVREGYDVWRVICRGPIPSNVYQYYLPTIEYQLDPADALANGPTATPKRLVPVADRAVIWACPHAGDVWIGSSHPAGSPRPVESTGSLVDADTQAGLGLFLSRGGRLFLSGEDLAWALTLNGTVTNDFLGRYLHCSFNRDIIAGNVAITGRFLNDPDTTRILHTDYGFSVNAPNGNDPVAFDPWTNTVPGDIGGLRHFGLWAEPSAYDAADMPTSFVTPRIPPSATDPDFTDAHDWSLRPDVITPLNPTEVLYTMGAAGASGGSDVGGIRYADPTTSSRVVFLSFGFEQIHRQYHNPGSPLPPHCENKRSHLLHNAMCWMRTGAFQGKVVSISDGGKPVTNPNPIVFLYTGPTRTAGQTPDYAVRCQDDGTFVIQGLPPAFYILEAARPGFEIDHFDGWVVHGGWQPFTVDFAMTRARPAAVSGTVTSAATGKPIPLVKVTAYHKPTATPPATPPVGPPFDPALLTPAVATATTAADGTYTLPNLPVDPTNPDYVIVADGSGQGYSTNQALVTPVSGSTSTVNFSLTAANGTVTVTVLGINDPNNPSQTVPLANALVTVMDTQGALLGSGSSDATGVGSVSVQPGTDSVTAQAAGYQASTPQTVTVTSLQTTTLTIKLVAEPPGALSGRVVAATSGAAVGGVPVDFYLGTVRVHTEITSDTFTDPKDGNPPYNYRWASAQTGTYTIKPNPSGFTATPTERDNVVIATGAETRSVNFTLTSLHTFPIGLQLISTPYTYEATSIDPTQDQNDPAKLLGVPNLAMATWEAAGNTSLARYRIYPQAPADHFRLGRGYWLRLASPADISKTGKAATDPISIPLANGWNLIGDPYGVVMDLYSVQFDDGSGATPKLFQDALASGKLSTSLFAYVLGGYRNTSVLTPWVGYWIKANVLPNQTLNMILSQTTGALAAGAEKSRPAGVQAPKGGWLIPLQVAADGMADNCTYVGVAPKAADAYKPGLDMPKPPAADFGPYIYAAAMEQGWGQDSGAYAVDLKPTGTGSQTWCVNVTTSQVGAPVTVTWPDLSGLPRNVRPMLVDSATGRSTYMRTSRAYTFTASDAARQLKVVVDDVSGAAGTLTVAGMTAQQVAAGTSIVYTLSRAASVDVDIRNISGAPIRKVASGLVQTAGRNQATWNGRNDSGTAVPPGRYLVIVKARTDDGQETNAITTMMLGR